jgi:MinD superfamily P-loop ATPase
MLQVAVLSGKGGTGKTVVTAALADVLPGAKAFADCDVEAANLALLLSPKERGRIPFFGMKKAEIRREACVACGLCREACHFHAIGKDTVGHYHVDRVRCEGCAVCREVCPERAINLVEHQDGEIILADTAQGPLVYAELYPGSGNSGLLVHEVKKAALKESGNRDLLLIDGPPGIGCPVISTLSGINAAVLVTEPGIAALHDLRRLVTVSSGFSLSHWVVINRADLHPGYTRKIESYCAGLGIPVIGKIPFDPVVISAVRDGLPVTRRECAASRELQSIGMRLMEGLSL